MATRNLYPDASSNGQGDSADAATLPPVTASASAMTPMVREWQGIVADIEDLVTATTTLTGEDLARAKARLQQRVASAKAAVARTGAAIAQGARRSAAATDEYVHASPWKAVGIGAAGAAVLGFLLGLQLARRP